MRKNRIGKYFSHLVVLAMIVVNSSGCFWLVVGAAAGAGGVIWIKGQLQQQVNASLDSLHTATIKALKQMELPVIIDRKDKLTAKVESEFSDRARVRIDIDAVSAKVSKIQIRVGSLGDEKRSREIMDTIQHYL